MAWHQIFVTTNETDAPVIADFISELGAVSVTFMDAEDRPVYEPPLNTVQIWQKTIVIALFELDAHPAIIKALTSENFGEDSIIDWRDEILEDQVWERAWMEHFQPMLFADRLWICPTGMEVDEPDKVCMILDPGLAFGTGTHPTTALCLEWLASHDLRGKTIIDYGCGSGILAVAALLLGAEVAHAIDIDPQALTATLSNAQKNQVSDKLHCYLPEQFSASSADIVLANILAAPLIELAPHIMSLVKVQGNLVLSGILTEQADAVTSAYASALIMLAPVVQDDWCRLEGYKVA